MQERDFAAYLLERYPHEKSYRYRKDIISRCKRVENELLLKLDSFHDLTQLHGEVDAISKYQMCKATYEAR